MRKHDGTGLLLTAYYRLQDRYEETEGRRRQAEADIAALRGLLGGDALIPTQGVARLGGMRGAGGHSTPTEQAASRYGEELAHYQARLTSKEARLRQLTLTLQDLAETLAPVRAALARLAAEDQEILRRTYRQPGESLEMIARGLRFPDGEYRERSTIKYHLNIARLAVAQAVAGDDVSGILNG